MMAMMKNEILLEKAIKSIRTEYAEAKKRDYIHKPLSYAIYQTWKMVDEIERKKLEVQLPTV